MVQTFGMKAQEFSSLYWGWKKNRTTLQRGQDRSSNSLRVVQRTRTTGCIIVRHENTRATLVRGLTSACKVAQHSYCLSCNHFSSRQSLKISEQHGFLFRPRCDHFVASGSYNKWYNGYNESYNGKKFESQSVAVGLATIVKGASCSPGITLLFSSLSWKHFTYFEGPSG